MTELSIANIEENEEGLSEFLNTCKRISNRHAPRKQKYARGNHMNFVNVVLFKEIMTRARLQKQFFKR